MNTKRILAMLLTLCMVFSLVVPGVAFAEDEETALLVEEGTPAETQDENPVIEEQPEETTQTPVVEEIIEENEQPAESVTDETEQPAGNTDETQTPEQPDENGQPALASLDAQEVTQLGMGGGALPSLKARDEDAQLSEGEAVAQIGDTGYATLAEAISAANAGDTITMVSNTEITSTITLYKDITLDLNGQTVTMNVTSGMTGAFYLNGHSLTIQNNSANTGSMDITSSSGNGAYGFYVSGSGSRLTIEGGDITVRNATSTDYWSAKGIQAVYISSGSTFTMSGGSLTASNENNSGKAAYAVYLSGGTANITGGTIIVDDRDTNGWSDDHLVYKSSGTANITAGTFVSPKALDINGLRAKLGDQYMLRDDGDNTYTVIEKPAPVAQIGSTKYATLAEAIADVPDDTVTTIMMIGDVDIEVNAGITIPAGKIVVLDLNGQTISQNCPEAAVSYLIKNNGTLTLQDSVGTGEMNCTAAVPDTNGNPTYANNLISNYGTLTVKSGTYKVLTTVGFASYVIDNYSGATANVEGGNLTNTSQHEYVIRQFCNSLTVNNVLNISGGIITGSYAVWMQNTQQNKANKGSMNITGGTITANDGYAVWCGYPGAATSNDASAMSITISDGTINGGLGIGAKAGKPTVSVSGGYLSEVGASAEVGKFITGGYFIETPDTYVADGHESVALTNDDPAYAYGYRYKVVEKAAPTYVAEINGTQYATLAEAFAAANEADSAVTITLLADCDTSTASINNPLVLTKADSTLDLNGKTITVNNNFSFVMQGNGITVTNGSLISAPNAAKKTNLNSYILVINDCDGVNLSNLTMQGGLSIGGSQSDWGTTSSPKDGVAYQHGADKATDVTITNCNITSGDYYAVCSQMGSDAKIVSGTYTSNQLANSDVLYGYFVGADGPEGYITVTGGTFQGNIGTANIGWIVLKGGTYTVKPADGLVADGYAAVQVDSVWKVGKVTVEDLAPTETITEATTEAIYTVPVIVKDGEETIGTDTAQNIKVSVDTTNDVASTRLSQISDLNNVVAAAVVSAGAQASAVTDIKVAVKSNVQTSAPSALTYEVHPEAIAYVNNEQVGNAVVITNAQIAGSTFTFRLDVTSLGVNVGGMVTATHHSEDNSFPDETNTYNVKSDDNGATKYITVTTTHFSTWTLNEKSANDAVATYTLAGTTYYADNLADAFANVEAGGTVKLLKDIELTKAIDVDKQVTLDTNGMDITHVSSGYTQDYLIGVKYGGDLTIKNNNSHYDEGWILASASNVYCAIKMTLAGETYTGTPAKLTVDQTAGAIKGYYYGISGNGTRNGTEITINGGEITGGDVDHGTRGCGIYHPQNGTLTINDGATINGGETAVEMRAGTLNINGGLFTAIATPTATNPNGSGTTSSGAAIAIAQHTTKQPISVTIKGGTFEGYSAFYESNPENNGDTDIAKISLSITGGEFKAVKGGSVAVYSEDAAANKINGFISGGSFSSIVENEYCAVGYIPKTEKVDGMYNVTEGWKISFDLSGATGTMPTQTVVKGNSFTVPALAEGVTAPANKEFDGWTFDSTAYAAGDSFTPTSDVTLTAKWKEAGTGGNGGYIAGSDATIRESLMWRVYFKLNDGLSVDVDDEDTYISTSAHHDATELNGHTFKLSSVKRAGDTYYMITVPIRPRLINEDVGFTLVINGVTYTLRTSKSATTEYISAPYSFNSYLDAINDQSYSGVIKGLRDFRDVLLEAWPVN